MVMKKNQMLGMQEPPQRAETNDEFYHQFVVGVVRPRTTLIERNQELQMMCVGIYRLYIQDVGSSRQPRLFD